MRLYLNPQPKEVQDPAVFDQIRTSRGNHVNEHRDIPTGRFCLEEDLDAIPQPKAFGQRALNAVIEGRADMGTVADTPIMFAVMSGKRITILAVMM
jgi:hypothetical protein